MENRPWGWQAHRLERTRIDDVKQIAGMDDRAVAKLDVGDEAADPGANLNLFHRLEPPGEFIPIGDGTFGRLCHRDRRWSGRRLRRRLVAATGQGDREHNEQWRQAAE